LPATEAGYVLSSLAAKAEHSRRKAAVLLCGDEMHICFVDESGDSSTLNTAADTKQAALIIGALFIDTKKLPAITADFMQLKRVFYPREVQRVGTNNFDALLLEIKGSTHITSVVRKKTVRHPSAKRALLFLDGVLDLCIRHQVRLVGRTWIKEIQQPMLDKSVYTVSAQSIAERFQEFLAQNASEGVIIADFRDHQRNSYVAHSVFTQMHKKSGSAYPRIQETVAFGISHNHAGLQIADLITSAALLPLVAKYHLIGRFRNAHTHPSMHIVAQRVERKIKLLEFSFRHPQGMCRGLTVADPRDKRAKFFPVQPAPAISPIKTKPAAHAAPAVVVASVAGTAQAPGGVI
jgi:hypothetical protein